MYQWNNTKMGKNVSFHMHVKSEHGYSAMYTEHVFSVVGISFLSTSIMGFTGDIHKNKCTSEITPESANMKLFIFMLKVNMGTLPSTHNTFSMLLESICHAKALVKNCDKSQIATVVSQFVTVAICDGSKYNFSDWCRFCQKVYS